MYCLMTDKGASPTVETKYEFVHKDGILERSHPYSCLKTRDVRPFISFTALCMPNCGSTSMSKWMWSGMISISNDVDVVFAADFLYEFLQAYIDTVDQDLAAVFWTPDYMILAGVHHIVIAFIFHGFIIPLNGI